MRKILLFVLTLCLGAVAYSLLRTERQGGEAEPETEPEPSLSGREPPREAEERKGGSEPASQPPPKPAPPPKPEPAGEPAQGCQATTRSGKPCTRPAEPGSRFCWQHGG